MLFLGLVSTLLTVYIAHRMDGVDHETYPAHMTLVRVRFWLFLADAVRQDPRGQLLGGFYVVCAVLLVLDFILHRHVAHSRESLPGFYALFGFVACVALVLIAKEMRKVVMRKVDYYDVDE